MPQKATTNSAILLVDCPDQKGLVAAIANFLLEHGANILDADQHQDAENGFFFTRIEWDLQDFRLDEAEFQQAFKPLAEKYRMQWRVEYRSKRLSVALFVSHYLHCLADLLNRYYIGELDCNISLIVSNHTEAKPLADFHSIPFFHVPVTRDNKKGAESLQLALLTEHKIDLIILARYMQILSPDFVNQYPRRIINVHHSFLPAFTGAQPYHAAYERGVKLIGATSHYVTDDLDEGPIIEQDIVRVTHRDLIRDLIVKGRDTERTVLARAVKWHLDRRIICHGNKTVVFT